MRTSLVLLLVTVPLLGCSDSDSPTATLPQSRDLEGTFTGPLPVKPPGEDWSEVTMDLTTNRNVSGVLRPKVGTERPVAGTFVGSNLIMSVGNLAPSPTCYEISLNIFRFEANAANETIAFEGTIQGTCEGTLSGTFRMERK